MKYNKIFNISAGIALLLGGTACSSDYLSLEPEGTIDYETALTNPQGASLAINGLCQSMSKQYSALSSGSIWFNGEPWVSNYYGEVMGQDFISLFWFNNMSLMNWTDMNNYQSTGAYVGWAYYYGLISQANNILTFAPKKKDDQGQDLEDPDFNFNPVPDVEGEYAFRYAQALTFRAHSYIRLMQLYGARYENRFRENGQYTLTVPMRLTYVEPEGDLNCPLATWEELMNQIYGDLQQAISLYESSGWRRSANFEPDIEIAKGLLARIAMVNHDWALAQQMAREARAGYEIMTSDEYLQGFAVPNSEWMWTNTGDAQGMYYYSFGATNACNGAYPCLWGSIGAGAISNDLIKQFNRMDLRVSLFFSPLNQTAVASDFWSDQCNSNTMDINSGTGTLHTRFVDFCTQKYKNVADFNWDPPYTFRGYPISSQTTIVTALFGAQFKFYGTDVYSSSCYPFMRASELLLTEAEAAYMQGDENTALSLITELNNKRYITSYNSKPSGDALLKEIKMTRRIELWGEGYSWFDLKRWNEPLTRTAWKKNDVNSGNWPTTASFSFTQEENRGWRWRIPLFELDYNHAIDYADATTGAD